MARECRGSINGPDWEDVRSTMRAVGEFHKATCYVEMCSDGYGVATGLSIVVYLVGLEGASELEAPKCGVSGSWPNPNQRELSSAVYKLLLDLDAEASKVLWAQGKLFPGGERGPSG